MNRNVYGILVVLLALSGFASKVRAEYVLPYPGFMPGNKLYAISRFMDKLKRPLYYGPIGSFKYYLALSDKYLVEAKTLFEYKQYLLAVDALERSDDAYVRIRPFITEAKRRGVDTAILEATLVGASAAHKERILGILRIAPSEFRWSPEKSPETMLMIGKLLETSVALRIYETE